MCVPGYIHERTKSAPTGFVGNKAREEIYERTARSY
jgi:hypothetical protein